MSAAAPPVIHLSETDSTNAEALRRAFAGERGPLWIVTDRQTAGRGRSGRRWASQSGNLLASLLITLEQGTGVAYQLSLVAGVAVYDAVRPLLAETEARGLRLKWPNDLLLGRAKLAGILVESATHPGSPALSAVIGIGINLASHPEDLGRLATHLAAHGVQATPQEMQDKLGSMLAEWLLTWNSGAGFDRVRSAWLARGGPLGEPLVVNTGGGPVEGRFQGLAEDGALLIADAEGGIRRIGYGDVTLAG